MNKARKIARKVGFKTSTKVRVHSILIIVGRLMGVTCIAVKKNCEGFTLKQ